MGYLDLHSLQTEHSAGALALKLALTALGLLALLASGISSTDAEAQAFSCADSGAVANPGDNPLLVQDCETLFSNRDTLAGDVQLDWSANIPIEQWEGVTVEGSPLRVVEIRLENRLLSGRIPPELGALTGLKRLELGGNELSGAIPRQLGNLESLTVLDLSQNSLTGEIPPELGNLRNLESLALGSNELTGNIPQQLGNLRDIFTLNLQSNELTGGIPDTLGRLSGLNGLYLRDNQLTGGIPTWISGITQLQSLDLGDNQLTGAIPPGLGSLSVLRTLYLFNNDLSGTIPSELGNLTQLADLHLGGNQLSGPLPAALGRLQILRALTLDDNSLTGEIPSAFAGLTALGWLSLEGNQLSGVIPSSLGSLPSLRGLNLGRNVLNGIIPPALSGLTDLQFLRLNDNFLIGSVPTEFADLAQLEELDVSNNFLTGCMPWHLSRNLDLELTHDGLPDCPRPPPVVNEGATIFIEVSDLLEDTELAYAINSHIGFTAAINGRVWLEGRRVGFKHDGSETSTASFTYTARSGAVSITRVVPIDVTPVNDPPIAAADTAEVDEGEEVSVDASALLLNDIDFDNSDLQVTWVGDATNGGVSLVGASVTYVHDGSETIAGRFSYTISDGVASDTAIVRVAVTPVNDPPVAAPDTVEVDEGASASIESALLLLNDIDEENDSLRVTEVGGAVNGAVTLDGATIVYTHDGTETAEGGFTYVVSDGLLDGAGVVRVTIASVNDPPTAIPDRALVYEGDSVLLEAEELLRNDTDPDSDSLRIEAVGDAVNGTVSLDGATITYTHDGSETTEGSFIYSVSDGATHDTAIVRVAVRAEQAAGDSPGFSRGRRGGRGHNGDRNAAPE